MWHGTISPRPRFPQNCLHLYDGVNPVQELSGGVATANLLTGCLDQYFQRTDSRGPTFDPGRNGPGVRLTSSNGRPTEFLVVTATG